MMAEEAANVSDGMVTSTQSIMQTKSQIHWHDLLT